MEPRHPGPNWLSVKSNRNCSVTSNCQYFRARLVQGWVTTPIFNNQQFRFSSKWIFPASSCLTLNWKCDIIEVNYRDIQPETARNLNETASASLSQEGCGLQSDRTARRLHGFKLFSFFPFTLQKTVGSQSFAREHLQSSTSTPARSVLDMNQT